MHSYSKNFPYAHYIYVVLAIIAVAIYYFVSKLDFVENVTISPAITFTIFGALVLLFEHFLWRIFCFIPAIHLVNYSGTYEGTMTSFDEDGQKSLHGATITVKQRWSKMIVVFKSGAASSKSFSASVIGNRQGINDRELWYNYFTEGKNEGGQTMIAHYGTTKLSFSEDKKVLSGNYYTEQDRNSYGVFNLRKTS